MLLSVGTRVQHLLNADPDCLDCRDILLFCQALLNCDRFTNLTDG